MALAVADAVGSHVVFCKVFDAFAMYKNTFEKNDWRLDNNAIAVVAWVANLPVVHEVFQKIKAKPANINKISAIVS